MPPSERPAPRPGLHRPTAVVTKIPWSGPPLGKFAPYVVAALVTAVPVLVLIRLPRYAQYGAIGLVGLLALGCGWLAMSARSSLAPGDGLRKMLPLVTVIALAAAVVPFAYAIFPPAPSGEVRLTAIGDSAAIELTGTAGTTWITVSGRFVPRATGATNYFVTVAHGGRTDRVDGAFRPHAGAPAPEIHVLSMRGPGRYTVRLEQVSAAIAMPLSVSLSAKPFSTLILLLLFGSITVAVLAVDTMLFRRGIEPAVAASLMLPMIAAMYFQRNPMSTELGPDLLAAGVIGLIGGGIGGELLGRIARAVAPK